jgi:uncharacterized protein
MKINELRGSRMSLLKEGITMQLYQENPKFKEVGVAIIVKLSNNCNLSCTYCGVAGPLVRERGLNAETMDLNQILLLFDKIANSEKLTSVDFIWHGGEPLLSGLPFFRKIMNAQKEKFGNKGITIKNSIQTNGALVNDEWAAFMKENAFQLGVSIDGPEELHNRQRKAVVGKSYAQVMHGIELLRKYAIPFGALAVVTKDGINFGAKELFEFFVRNGIYTFDFLPQEPIFDENGKQLTPNIYPSNEYVVFANELFDIWYNYDNPNIHILLFEEIMRTMLGKGSKICQIGHGICANTTFTFYPDGTIRPCDKFPRAFGGVKGKVIAKINEIDKIDDIFLLKNYKQLVLAQITSLSMCENCKWRSSCKGACTFDRYMYRRNALRNNQNCSTYKIYEHIYDKIKDQLSESI